MNPALDVKLKQILESIFSTMKTDSEVKKDRIRVYKIDRRNLCKS
jgi:hypothetical protein